jgi:pyridoxamine 5'-phosphate oxidase
MPAMNIADLRIEYSRAALDEAHSDADAIRQFTRWWDEAMAARVREANAMTVATADADGRPAARTCLLKGYDERGFVFFTNYRSRKGRELDANPRACLLFFWPELERQVRIDGAVERASEQESDEYFRSRPLASRIGAWASPQSEVIASKAWLLARAAEMGLRHGVAPARPAHWGGYRVAPSAVEFWQGRPSRLHDRLLYKRSAAGWDRVRLAP